MSDLSDHMKYDRQLPSPEELVLRLHHMERLIEKLTQRISALEQKDKATNNLKNVRENQPGSLTTQEVLQHLKISRRTLYEYRKKGRLAGKKIGNKYLYRKEEVEKLLP